VTGGPVVSFAAAYDEHVWTVYGFIAYRVGSRDDAEDLTQQTFERALRAWGRFDPAKASMATWLLTIARNLVIDHYRARREHAELDDLGDAEPRTHASYDLGLSPALAGALASLSPRDREVVALRYGGDLTGPEIAEVRCARAESARGSTVHHLDVIARDGFVERQAAVASAPATRPSSAAW